MEKKINKTDKKWAALSCTTIGELFSFSAEVAGM
jgi:hypothetical protein